jgi:predicted HTH transcriptional regulator
MSMTRTEPFQPKYLKEPESRRLEFKETFSKGEQVVRTAVAFANGTGGKIVFGVKDTPREIVGIPDGELFALEEKITASIFNQCAPTIVPEIYIQAAEGKSLLVVEIFPGSHKPYYIKAHGKQEGAYIRVGSSNRKASLESIEALERQRRKVSFDSLPVYDCPPEDVDLSGFKKAYLAHTGKPIEATQLQNMGLLYAERDQVLPTHAALLLSSSLARKRYFPYAKLECARFKGTDKRVFLDQATVDGPVHEAVEPCMAFIKKNIALGATIGEIYRQERWEYPLEAVREALINAIIHRDYAILGSDIKVAIYDHMLEITSPGPLPDGLPIEELGTGRSEIRNRVLAPIFKDLKLIEAWGSGIQKMRDELADYPEIELRLHEAGHAFQAQFIKKETVKAESGQSQGRVRAESGQSEARVKPELSQSEARVEPGFIRNRILDVLANGPLSKSEISRGLGQKGVSGPLNAAIRSLRQEGLIEYTISEKPNSRLQKYRLKDKSKEANT